MTTVLGTYKFSLEAAIYHHGPSMYSGRYTSSTNGYIKTIFQRQQITEFEMIDTKNSSTAYVVMYKLITSWVLD